MKKRCGRSLGLIIVVLVGLPLIGLSKVTPMKSAWVTVPPAVDGSLEEWGDASFSTFKKARVDYAFKNDGGNVYVCFIFKEPKFLSSLNETGLTIWLNRDGEEKKVYGIRLLKKKVTPDFYIAYLEKSGNVLSEADKAKIKTGSAYYFNEAAVVDKKGQPVEGAAEAGAVFRSRAQNGQTVYEISLPLARDSDLSQGIGAQPGGTFAIGFEWGGVTEEMREKWRPSADTNLAAADRAANGSVAADPRSVGSTRLPRTPEAPKYTFWSAVELARK